MRILVIGGAGFFGRPIVRQLLDAQHSVTTLDNHEVRPTAELDARATHIVDCAHLPSAVEQALWQARPSAIYYLAAKQGYGEDWAAFGQRNVGAAYAFFQGLLGYWRALKPDDRPMRLILASSQAVYSPGMYRREQDATCPPSIYGLSKLQQEQAFQAMGRMIGLPIIALRPCIVLGPGQSMASEESGILRNWWRATNAGTAPEIYGSGSHMRDFVHVEDVAEAFVKAATDPCLNMAINLNGKAYTIREVAAKWHRASGCQEPRVLGKDVRPGGEFDLTSAGELAKRVLGWEPTIGIDRMIREFIRSAAPEREHLAAKEPDSKVAV